jgi:hypothetical protein
MDEALLFDAVRAEGVSKALSCRERLRELLLLNVIRTVMESFGSSPN